MKNLALLLLVFVLTTISSAAFAEQKQTLGDWDVHYIAMPTTLLQPEIARENQITRSILNGLINISVLNRTDQQAQAVSLSGRAKNLLGQTKELSFREVRQGQAIYYLAQYQFRGEERITIEIDITQGPKRQQLKFDHTFYPEEL